MELRVLRYFLAVAGEGSFTKASNLLHVSQPALSKQIMDLEGELNCKLFARGSHSVRLTESGHLLKRRAEEILEIAERTRNEFSDRLDNISGEIYIGAGETSGIRTIADVACELRSKYPSITFNFHSGNAEDIMERLDKGLLDFGLIIQPADISRYDTIKLPNKDIWGVIMHKASRLASRKAIKREDLFGEPLIMSKQISRRISNEGGIAKWLGSDMGMYNIIAKYNLLFNASVMAAKQMGYVVGLDGIVDTSPKSALCFKPLMPKLESEMGIIWKKDRPFSAPADLFLTKIREYCNRFATDSSPGNIRVK